MKNISGTNKFSVKSLRNSYYYDSDLAQPVKNENQIMNSNKSEEARTYLIACSEIDELISRGSDKYSE